MTTRTPLLSRSTLICGMLVLVQSGCTVTRDAGALTGTGGSSGDAEGTSSTSGSQADSEGTTEETEKLDLGTFDLPTDECVSVAQTTMIEEGPSDIIIVVDHTVSHDLLEATFQNFSLLIGNDDLEDVRVVMIAGYPSEGGGVCVDEAPLGTGECPSNDDNPPMYLHVDEQIQASTLLSQVLNTHDAWDPQMRSDAWKHIWVVSSADASMPTEAFVAALEDLDASFERLTVHAMVPLVAGDCSALLPGTEAGATDNYVALATATGGVVESLCNYSLKVLFNEMLDTIHEVALSCTYEIPAAPDDQVFDRERVNVDYDDGFGLQTIGHVNDASDCSGVPNGWYYDDPGVPSQILMCPQTCARFGTLQEASIEIRFGCATVPAG